MVGKNYSTKYTVTKEISVTISLYTAYISQFFILIAYYDETMYSSQGNE